MDFLIRHFLLYLHSILYVYDTCFKEFYPSSERLEIWHMSEMSNYNSFNNEWWMLSMSCSQENTNQELFIVII